MNLAILNGCGRNFFHAKRRLLKPLPGSIYLIIYQSSKETYCNVSFSFNWDFAFCSLVYFFWEKNKIITTLKSLSTVKNPVTEVSSTL
jgi:hypothetical protein